MPWSGPDGVEVAAEILPFVPQRTWTCSGREFKRLKAAAQARRTSWCCLPVLSPVGLPADIWYGVANTCDLTYTAFLVALSIAFNAGGSDFAASWLTMVDLVGSCIYLLDLLLGFHLGVVARWKDRAVVIRDGRTAARFYIRHGTFWTDFLATLPLLIQLVVASASHNVAALRLVFLLRLLRLVRVYRLLANLSRNSIGGPLQFLAAALTIRTIMLLHAFFSLCVLVNLLGCLWWNMAVHEGLENSWAAAVNKDFDLLTASDPQRWLTCCYYILTVFTTIGFGDIIPVTIKEIGLTMFFEVVGAAFFAYSINVVTSILTATGPDAMREVEEAMSGAGLSVALRRRIRSYFASSWAPPESFDTRSRVFSDLSPKLRQRVMAQQQRPALLELGFFPAGMRHSEQQACCALLAAASVPVLLGQGQQLEAGFAAQAAQAAHGAAGWLDDHGAEGSPHCFLLGEGRMDATVGGGGVFTGPALLGLAQLFAADSALADALDAAGLGGCQHAAATALTSCSLWKIDCARLYPQLRSQQPGLLRHLALKVLGWLEGDGMAPPSPPRPDALAAAEGSAAACKQLRGLAAELAEEQQRLEAGRGASKGRMQGAISRITAATSAGSTQQRANGAPELAGVAVSGCGPPADAGPLATVWHCD